MKWWERLFKRTPGALCHKCGYVITRFKLNGVPTCVSCAEKLCAKQDRLRRQLDGIQTLAMEWDVVNVNYKIENRNKVVIEISFSNLED